jgi:hypothetical protein
VLRNSPNCKWFAWSFAVSVSGFRPFQAMLNVAYVVLSDVRPIFGCKSCGAPGLWVRPFAWLVKKAKTLFGESPHPDPIPHFTSRPLISSPDSGRLPPAVTEGPQAGK